MMCVCYLYCVFVGCFILFVCVVFFSFVFFFFFFCIFFFFFFFKQKTAYEIVMCWSSDVCSSDLMGGRAILADEVGLDRLAEADFVRQDRAATHLAQHPLGHVDLVGQLLDRVRVEGDQPVEEIGRASCRERWAMWGGGVT